MESRGEAENSGSKTHITAKVSHNQSPGYRKFKRSPNVKPLLLVRLSPNLGKHKCVRYVKTEEVSTKSPILQEPLQFPGEITDAMIKERG